MKIFNFIFLLLFIISAGLQYNDPDPVLWILIYLFGAMICFFALRDQRYPRLSISGIILLLAYAIYLFFDKNGVLIWLTEHQAENIAGSMKASTPWIEETREFFGLAILISVLSVNLLISNKDQLKWLKLDSFEWYLIRSKCNNIVSLFLRKSYYKFWFFLIQGSIYIENRLFVPILFFHIGLLFFLSNFI